MNNTISDMAKFRTELIAQLRSPVLDVQGARQLIAAALNSGAYLFDAYKEDSLCEPINTEKTIWHRSGYFNNQVRLLDENFSQQRVYHLLDVYSYLSGLGIKGFTDTSGLSSAKETSPVKHSISLTDYIPDTTLKNLVELGDAERVRSALINELEDSRYDDDEVTKALLWSSPKVPGLFDAYEETTLAKSMNIEPAQWTPDYYYLQTSYINFNFSRERFEHLIAVRNELRRRGVKGFQRIVVKKQESRIASTPGQKTTSNSSSSKFDTSGIGQKKSPLPLIIGGALATLAAIIIALIKG